MRKSGWYWVKVTNRGKWGCYLWNGSSWEGERGDRYSDALFDVVGPRIPTPDEPLQPAEQPECGCCGQTDRCDDDCDAVVIGGHRAVEQQSAPVFHDEDHVSIPRGLITAACSAIDKKRDGTKTLAELRRYTFGDLSKQPAPEMAMLVAALEKARDAIASLPKDALGNVPDTQQCQGWHIRDELINDISTALAAYRNQGGES